MSLKEQLKAASAKTVTVEIDGMSFLVKGLTRTAKNELSVKCRVGDKTDNELFEAMLLAKCVCDPESGELVEPDANQWDIPAHISEPLVQACIDVCGFTKKDEGNVKN